MHIEKEFARFYTGQGDANRFQARARGRWSRRSEGSPSRPIRPIEEDLAAALFGYDKLPGAHERRRLGLLPVGLHHKFSTITIMDAHQIAMDLAPPARVILEGQREAIIAQSRSWFERMIITRGWNLAMRLLPIGIETAVALLAWRFSEMTVGEIVDSFMAIRKATPLVGYSEFQRRAAFAG
jgi:hypothetical protein